jgi:hypothetical protein
MRLRIDFAHLLNYGHSHPSAHMHRQMDGNQVRRPNDFGVEQVNRQIDAADLRSNFAQPGRRRGQSKGLSP